MQFSIVNYKNLDSISLRIDAEYYHPQHILFEGKLNDLDIISLKDAGIILDCSAFYPSIVQHYNFFKTGMPFLRVNEIQNGLLDISDSTVFLPPTIIDENLNTISICNIGDIIVAKGGNSLGKVALLTDDYTSYSVCRDVVVLRTTGSKLLNKYFLWVFLHCGVGQQLLLRTASQTGQPHLTVEAISQIKVPLFSDEFQQIFQFLYENSKDAKKRSEILYRKAEHFLLSELGLANWQSKRQLSFIKPYSEVDNAERFDAEYFQPKYDKIMNHLSDYGSCPLDEQFDMIRGSYFPYDSDGDIKVIKTKQVGTHYLHFDTDERTTSSIVKMKKLPIVDDGDVIFASMGVGSLGRACIAYNNEIKDENLTIDSTLKIFRKKNGGTVEPEVLEVFLNSIIAQEIIYKYIVGTSGIISIYDQDLKNVRIPLIPSQVQSDILQIVQSSHKKRLTSQALLEIAKRGVELAIEQSEDVAEKWVRAEVEKLGVAF